MTSLCLTIIFVALAVPLFALSSDADPQWDSSWTDNYNKDDYIDGSNPFPNNLCTDDNFKGDYIDGSNPYPDSLCIDNDIKVDYIDGSNPYPDNLCTDDNFNGDYIDGSNPYPDSSCIEDLFKDRSYQFPNIFQEYGSKKNYKSAKRSYLEEIYE